MNKVNVELSAEAGKDPVKLDVRIGDFQPGSHMWEDGVKPDNYPSPISTIWETSLRNVKGKFIAWSSAALDRNPNTNWVSVHVKVNDEEIISDDLEFETEENGLVIFEIKLNFL